MIGGMWVVSLLGNETSTNIPNNLTRLLGCCFLKKIFTLFQKKKLIQVRFFVWWSKNGCPELMQDYSWSIRSIAPTAVNGLMTWFVDYTYTEQHRPNTTGPHQGLHDISPNETHLLKFLVLAPSWWFIDAKAKLSYQISPMLSTPMEKWGKRQTPAAIICQRLTPPTIFFMPRLGATCSSKRFPILFYRKETANDHFSNLKSYDSKNNTKKKQPTEHKNGDVTSMSPCPPLFHINLARDRISFRTHPHWKKPRIAIKCCQNGRIHKRWTWKCSLLKVGDRHHAHKCMDCLWKHDATHWSCIT